MTKRKKEEGVSRRESAPKEESAVGEERVKRFFARSMASRQNERGGGEVRGMKEGREVGRGGGILSSDLRTCN